MADFSRLNARSVICSANMSSSLRTKILTHALGLESIAKFTDFILERFLQIPAASLSVISTPQIATDMSEIFCTLTELSNQLTLSCLRDDDLASDGILARFPEVMAQIHSCFMELCSYVYAKTSNEKMSAFWNSLQSNFKLLYVHQNNLKNIYEFLNSAVRKRFKLSSNSEPTDKVTVEDLMERIWEKLGCAFGLDRKEPVVKLEDLLERTWDKLGCAVWLDRKEPAVKLEDLMERTWDKLGCAVWLDRKGPVVKLLRDVFMVIYIQNYEPVEHLIQLYARVTLYVARDQDLPPGICKSEKQRGPQDTNRSRFIPRETLDEFFEQQVNMKDVYNADIVERIRQALVMDAPVITWDQLQGIEDVKELFEVNFIMPSLRPELFRGVRQPFKSVLLYGPPGTGKSTLAHAAAAKCDLRYLRVTNHTFASRWHGDQERMVNLLFKFAEKVSPVLMFIDEIDSIAGKRSRSTKHEADVKMLCQLMTCIDDLLNSSIEIYIVAATNCPWDLDEAILRRFGLRVYFAEPNIDVRVQMMRHYLGGFKVAPNVDYRALAGLMVKYSGSDVKNACKKAAMAPINEFRKSCGIEQLKWAVPDEIDRPIASADLEDAIRKTRGSLNKEQLEKFEKCRKDYESM